MTESCVDNDMSGMRKIETSKQCLKKFVDFRRDGEDN